ncbi:ATP-binding protein [Nocardiopsis coralliicola]
MSATFSGHRPGAARGAGAVVMARCGYPGEPGSVAEARIFVRSTLGLCPALGADLLDAAELLVSEIASNAVRHTRSGEDGGRFGVEVWLRDGRATVAVHDEGPRETGARTRPRVHPLSADAAAEGGRGLALVEAIAQEWSTYSAAGGRAVVFSVAPGGAGGPFA